MIKNKYQNMVLLTAVFVCGAVVMIFEVLASRVLGPYLGTSFYTWTSIIGVIMASLSLGYYLGGKWADRKADLDRLSLIIFLSALTLLLTVFIKPLVLEMVRLVNWGIELESLVAASMLFILPSFFLAMITPFSVKIKLASLNSSARTVGALYSLSTLGSIVGTFLAGFVLIPFLGTALLLNILILVLTGVSLLVSVKKYQLFKVVLILATGLLMFMDVSGAAAMTLNDPLVLETRYNTVWIYDYTDPASGLVARALRLDPYGTQSAIIVDKPDQLLFEYTKYYRLAEFFKPDFKKTLMIGGCAYSFPKFFLKNYPGAGLDVVEIDPGMTEIARKYFKMKDDPRMRIFHEDGRTFLNNSSDRYDVIYGDAFSSFNTVPFQLTTVETVQRMSDLLNDDGVVIINLIGSLEGKGADFLRWEYATYSQIFRKVYLFRVKDISNDKQQNIMLVAVKGRDRLEQAEGAATAETEPVLASMLKRVIDVDKIKDFSGGSVLTDDFAPVEYFKYQAL
jgi:spermidine synthase